MSATLFKPVIGDEVFYGVGQQANGQSAAIAFELTTGGVGGCYGQPIEINLTSAEILGLATNPRTVLPPPGMGRYWRIEGSTYQISQFGGSSYVMNPNDNGGAVGLFYTDTAGQFADTSLGFFPFCSTGDLGPTNGWLWNVSSVRQSGGRSWFENAPIILGCRNGYSIQSGNSDGSVTIYYSLASI